MNAFGQRLWFGVSAFTLSLVMAVTIIPPETVEAASGSCYFTSTAGTPTGTGTCSVSGYGAYGTNDVLSGRNSRGQGFAIGDSVNSKTDFINFIIKRFNGSENRNKVGAAFIMQEMRGSRAWPGSSEVADWKTRMQDSSVTFSRTRKTVKTTSWYMPSKRNVFYDNYTVKRYVVEIRQSGKLIATIERECGNMVSGTIALKTIPKWNVDPYTSVSPSSTVYAGNSIKWTHTIRNQGPNTSKAGRYTILGSPRYVGSGSASGSYGALGNDRTTSTSRTYVTTSSDVGRTYCQSIRIAPNSWNNSGSHTSTARCVRVIDPYQLTPDVELSADGAVEANSLTDVVGTVSNDSRTTGRAAWQLSKIVVTPTGTITNRMVDGTQSPCTWYKNTCTSVRTGTQSFSSGERVVANLRNEVIDALPVGSKVCWALSVKPPSSETADQNRWRHSAPKCLVIAKKPKLQILGGDARVRGSIRTSTSFLSTPTLGGNRLFGSWGEFGVMSANENIAMGSGAALRKGNAAQEQSAWSGVTFANAVSTSQPEFGHYASLPQPADIAGYFKDQESQPASGNFTLPGKSGVFTASGNLSVSGNVTTGRTVVIVSSGTVTISGNVAYSGSSYTSIDQIPQLIIIARNINVASTVTRIDAWLLADTTLNTCAGRSLTNPGLTAALCNQSLTINGPVAASELYLFRTAGAGTGNNAKTAAETINLRPDAYLWAYNYALDRTRPTTVSLTELPPRY